MASPAAQAAYNNLTPEQKAQVDATTAGNPNGLDDWYQASAKAGDPNAIRAGGVGQSEDFDRFNNGTVTGWAKGYYDEAASKAAGRPQFRSMRGAPGFFDKPTECPPGQGPSGPNESDPCTTKGYSEPAAGAASAAPAAEQSASYYGQDDPLQRYLTGLMSAGGGTFGGSATGGPYAGGAANAGAQLQGGGVMWTGGPATPTNPSVQTAGAEARPAATGATTQVASAYGGINPSANLPASTAVAPAPAANFSAQPAAGANSNPWGTVTGVQSADPLAGLVDPRAKRKDARSGASWF